MIGKTLGHYQITEKLSEAESTPRIEPDQKNCSLFGLSGLRRFILENGRMPNASERAQLLTANPEPSADS